MEYSELVDYAERLIKTFGDISDIVTMGNMLADLDEWRNTQCFYIKLIEERI